MNIISPSYVGNLVLFPPTEKRKANRELKEPLFLFFSFLGEGKAVFFFLHPRRKRKKKDPAGLRNDRVDIFVSLEVPPTFLSQIFTGEEEEKKGTNMGNGDDVFLSPSPPTHPNGIFF